MLKWILGFFNALCLMLIILFVSIYIPTFSLSYYEKHYNEHNTADNIQISDEELMLVTSRLLGYMKGDYNDLYIYATIDGFEREFFNQREIHHMEDVRYLFYIGYILRDISIIGFILSLLYALFKYKEDFNTFCKSYLIFFSTILFCVLSLVLLIFTDFDKYFIIFHEIFFFNDLWILNPETDLLINLVPLEFFINIFKTVSIIFLASIISLILVSSSFLFYKRKKAVRRV